MNKKISPSQKHFLWALLGIIISIAVYLINPFGQEEMTKTVLSIAVLMIYLWVTEILPMPVVAILPLILFPLFKISSLEEAATAYSNPIIFLFFGGFMLGLAIEKWQLHKRIALTIISRTKMTGDSVILGFIMATGFMSMWLSNTATTMMMYPIALSVIAVMSQQKQTNANYINFNMTIMLAIAYASNIGGIATIIGTPPNAAYIAFYENKYQSNVDFASWFFLCAPISIALLILLYLVMVKWLFPNHILSNKEEGAYIHDQLKALGPMGVAEKRVLTVFCITAALWIFRSPINELQPYLKLDDTIIALVGACLLFIIPSGYEASKGKVQFLMSWKDTHQMAWGILLLFGGGICLATAMEKAGIIQSLGAWLSGNTANIFVLVTMVTVLSIFISEVMSNVAQVIVFAPVVSAMADHISVNPLLLGIPMTLAASCASMLPMGTPPNAIVFASNKIKMKDMIKIGFVMNILACILIVLSTKYILPLVFG